MWWLAIPALVAVGGWLYGARLVATKAPPLAHDTFTAKGIVQVGDVVTVSAVSVEDVDLETSLKEDGLARSKMIAIVKPEDIVTFTALDMALASGGTAQFKVTATGLANKDGVPVSIGILVNPPISFRAPFAFLTASVQKIERNGKVLA